MGNAFRDLDELFAPQLELTIGGKVYVVEAPAADVGLWCERVMQTGVGLHLSSDDEQAGEVMARFDSVPRPAGAGDDVPIQQVVLGAAYDRMVADGVKWAHVKFAGMTAFIWIAMGEDAARAYWEAGGRPEALAPNRAARRRTSPRTGAASTTRKRGSTSTTTSPTTSGPAKPARRSPGGTS